MAWKCPKCGKKWAYALEYCIECREKLVEEKPGAMKVIGVTKVFVPSAEHPDVPYYVLLLEDSNGNKLIKKSMKKFDVGDDFSLEEKQRRKRIVGIVGTGSMASGCAFACLSAGFDVIVRGRSQETLDKFKAGIEALAEKTMAGRKQELLSRLTLTTSYKSLANCELVIENVVEDLAVKQQVFREIEQNCRPTTILASNTSSLLVSDITKGLKHQERCVGMHFFNPVHRMRLVEVISTLQTSQETTNTVVEIASEMGKTAIAVEDSPGFIVNRVLFPLLNEAVLLLESGKASAEDIDRAAQLGLNHPMGPLHLVDLIGVDVFVEIMDNLKKETGDKKFEPAPLARKMAAEGKLGRKTKQGFFKY